MIGQETHPPGNFKTKKCRHFELGKCRLGTKCHFAHGETDVKQPQPVFPTQIPKFREIETADFQTTLDKIPILEFQFKQFLFGQKNELENLKENAKMFTKNEEQKFDLKVCLSGFRNREFLGFHVSIHFENA